MSFATEQARLIIPSLAAVPASDPSDVYTACAEAGAMDLNHAEHCALIDALLERLAKLRATAAP